MPKYMTKDALDLTPEESAKRWKWIFRDEKREEEKKEKFLINVRRAGERLINQTKRMPPNEREQARFLVAINKAADRIIARAKVEWKTKRSQRAKPSM